MSDVERVEQLLRSEPIHWRPGARELLVALRDLDVPCALVSASWRWCSPRSLITSAA